MKQEEAILQLRVFMLALQKYRSNAMEMAMEPIEATPEQAANMFPWIFGKKCPLEALSKTLDAVEQTGALEPMVYYNYMVILDRFLPEIRLFADTFYSGMGKLPKGPPSISFLAIGWDNGSGVS